MTLFIIYADPSQDIRWGKTQAELEQKGFLVRFAPLKKAHKTNPEFKLPEEAGSIVVVQGIQTHDFYEIDITESRISKTLFITDDIFSEIRRQYLKTDKADQAVSLDQFLEQPQQMRTAQNESVRFSETAPLLIDLNKSMLSPSCCSCTGDAKAQYNFWVAVNRYGSEGHGSFKECILEAKRDFERPKSHYPYNSVTTVACFFSTPSARLINRVLKQKEEEVSLVEKKRVVVR